MANLRNYIVASFVTFFAISAYYPICTASSQAGSRGREFVFAVPKYFTNPRKMLVNLTLVGESHDHCNVTVKIEGLDFSQTLHVAYHEATSISLPDMVVATDESSYTETISVVATGDISVSCVVGYQYGQKQGEGFLVLPVSALGTEYVVVTAVALDYQNYKAEFTVSSIADNTNVSIVSDTEITVFSTHYPPLEVVTILLGQHQSVSVRAGSDLTGTRVSGSHGIAVVSGNDCANVPRAQVRSSIACNFFVEQLVPTSAWGRDFLIGPFHRDAAIHVIRSVSKDMEGYHLTIADDAIQEVTVMGKQRSHDYVLSGDFSVRITSDRPIMVTQFLISVTRGYATSGGMATIPPIDQMTQETSVVMPFPKMNEELTDFIVPDVVVCIIIDNCALNALRVNELPLNSAVLVTRGQDNDICAVEMRWIETLPGTVLTVTSLAPSVRMYATVSAHYGNYLAFFFTASLNFTSSSQDMNEPEWPVTTAAPDRVDMASTNLAKTTRHHGDNPADTVPLPLDKGINLPPYVQFLFIAVGGFLTFVSAACLIIVKIKWPRHGRTDGQSEEPEHESSPNLPTDPDYDNIDLDRIDHCAGHQAPSTTAMASAGGFCHAGQATSKGRGRRAAEGGLAANDSHDLPCYDRPSGFNVLLAGRRGNRKSVMSTTSVSSDYGYVDPSLLNNDYVPMKAIKRGKAEPEKEDLST